MKTLSGNFKRNKDSCKSIIPAKDCECIKMWLISHKENKYNDTWHWQVY